MVQSKLKCALCRLTKTQCFPVNDEFLGRSLSSIIANLCGSEVKSNIQPTDNVCTECAVELWRTEKMMALVQSTFGQSLNKSSNDTKVFLFNCTTCEFSTSQLKIYKTHMLDCHGEAVLRPYACEHCGVAFTRLDNFKRHLEAMHVQTSSVSKKVTKNLNDAKNPEKKQETKSTNDETKNILKNIKTETIVNDNNAPPNDTVESDYLFKCIECKYTHDKPKIFRRHMMVQHNYNKNECFRCPLCTKCYERPVAFRNHMQKHQDEKLDNTTLNKQLAATTINEQTINNAKAMSTPLGTEKKVKKKAIESSTPLQKSKLEVLPTPVNVECSTRKKDKKKRDIEKNTTEEVEKKKTKIKEQTVLEETTIMNEVKETYACVKCEKICSSEIKLKKHMLKKHN